MSDNDLIRRGDALAAVQAAYDDSGFEPDLADAAARIAALPARGVHGVDAVLDAAHGYLMQQYGSSPLKHPADRARILAALEPVAALYPAAIRAAALREALAVAEYMADRNCTAADVARDLKRLIDKEPGNE